MITLKNVFYVIGLSALIFLTHCKKDSPNPTPSETDQQLEVLMNNGSGWVLNSSGVIKDGYDVTSQFTGFKLNIGDKTYSTINGLNPVWAVTGTWEFENNNPNLILRDGLTSINLSLSGGELILTFNADAVPTGGRLGSISGEYRFHLVSE